MSRVIKSGDIVILQMDDEPLKVFEVDSEEETFNVEINKGDQFFDVFNFDDVMALYREVEE